MEKTNSSKNSNGFSNSEMYQMSRNGAIESVGFWTSDLDYIKEKTTFAKAPNGTIASLYSWWDNSATYYEKVDGRWFELDEERTEAIQAELRKKGRKMVEAAKQEMEIKNALVSDFNNIVSDDEFIDSHIVGDFEISTYGYADEDETSMDVRLSLSMNTNYIDGVYQPFELHFDVEDEDDIDSVASEIADYISNTAKDAFFRIFQCYKDDNGRIWQLEACDGFECTLISMDTCDEEVVYAEIDEDAICMWYTDEESGETSYIYPANRYELGTVAA